MLGEDEVVTKEQLQDKNWLMQEMEQHGLELIVHKARLASYRKHLAKLVGETAASDFLKEVLTWYR